MALAVLARGPWRRRPERSGRRLRRRRRPRAWRLPSRQMPAPSPPRRRRPWAWRLPSRQTPAPSPPRRRR
eukprot:2047156-Alexandrium_andersonii.AAC.1